MTSQRFRTLVRLKLNFFVALTEIGTWKHYEHVKLARKTSMKKFTLSVFGIGLLSFTTLFGQTTQKLNPQNMRDGESVEYCQTHTLHREAMKDPAYAAIMQQAEIALQQKIEELKKENRRGTIYTIPVVFHILHNGGPENISRAQVLDGMRILAEDFRRLNADADNVHPDFKNTNPNATCVPTDTEIQFVLATKAPDGTVFGGITRTKSSLTNVSSSQQGAAQANAVRDGNDVYKGAWPGNKYLNIFVCNTIGGAAGYTRTPNPNTTMQNGIWLCATYLGSIGTGSVNTSRALTHEIGHWLNLSHTWGGTNDPEVACGTDNVDDTPVTRGIKSCSLNEAFCGPRANVENFMDYSYCSKMFSAGQVARMRAALNSPTGGRNNIWTQGNLDAVGGTSGNVAVGAGFSSNVTETCPGGEIKFTDESFNKVTGWSWSFPGGTPAVSTDQNPLIKYDTPGDYAVTLTITDGTTSKTVTKNAYIKVLPVGLKLPFLEGFETITKIAESNLWSVVNNDNNNKWEVVENVALSGKNSIKLGNFGQAAASVDELISAPWDLSDITATTGVTLSFRYAYRKRAAANDDFLKVFLTDDCGGFWSQRKTLHGPSLSNEVATTAWSPSSAADWTTVHMTNVVSSFWTPNFRFKFRFESDGGNNIFLDDINIYAGAPSNTTIAAINEAGSLSQAVVYPNPSEGELNVQFNVLTAQNVNVSVVDVLGNVLSQYVIQAAEGSNTVVLSTEAMASGMYFVRVGQGEQINTLQFVVK